MPRTSLAVVVPKGPHPGTVAAGALDTPFIAADQANGNQFPHTGSEILIMRNEHATNPGTVTIKSAPDPFGRTGDITTYSLAAAGGQATLLMSDTKGWRQSDGNVHLDIAGTGTVKFLVLKVR